jgi:hypothetical protein
VRWNGTAARTLRKGLGKIETIRVSVVGGFGQRPRQYGVEVREIGSAV